MTPTLTECLTCACEVCGASEVDVRRECGNQPGTFTARRLFYVLGHQYAHGSARTLAEFLGRSSKSGFGHATKAFYAALAVNDKTATDSMAAAKRWMAARGFTAQAEIEQPRKWPVADDFPVPRVYPAVKMPSAPIPAPLGTRYLRWASRPAAHVLPDDLRAEIDAKYTARLSRDSSPKLALLPTEAA